jgi:hypothetical protein
VPILREACLQPRYCMACMHLTQPRFRPSMKDRNCKLFILKPTNQDGTRDGRAYSFESSPTTFAVPAYFDTKNGMGPCFGKAFVFGNLKWGLSFLRKPVPGGGSNLFLGADRHLVALFGLADLSELTSGFPDKSGLGSSTQLSIYAVEEVPAACTVAPSQGTAPAGVKFEAEVSPTIGMSH